MGWGMATHYWLMETSFVHVIVRVELPKDMTAALLSTSSITIQWLWVILPPGCDWVLHCSVFQQTCQLHLLLLASTLCEGFMWVGLELIKPLIQYFTSTCIQAPLMSLYKLNSLTFSLFLTSLFGIRSNKSTLVIDDTNSTIYCRFAWLWSLIF